MKTNKSNTRFPFLIFFLLFIILFIFAFTISGGYFYFVGKNKINDIIENTRTYSISLTESFASVAELGYLTKNYTRLGKLFKKNVDKVIIEEAFFVVKSGRIIAHSDLKTVRELGGNIAADEFVYNLDQIFLPLKSKSKKVQFMDYNIFNYKFPFNIYFKKYLKKYFKQFIYDKIDIVGWLATRGVYYKGRGIGCVCLIINKKYIYDFVLEHFRNTVRLSIMLFICIFIISIVTSIMIFVRSKNIRTREWDMDWQSPEVLNFNSRSFKGEIQVQDKLDGYSGDNVSWKLSDSMTGKIDEKDNKRIIKDAIPISD